MLKQENYDYRKLVALLLHGNRKSQNCEKASKNTKKQLKIENSPYGRHEVKNHDIKYVFEAHQAKQSQYMQKTDEKSLKN